MRVFSDTVLGVPPRGEYETSEVYEGRLAAWKNRSASLVYGFKALDVTSQYDADRQALSVTTKSRGFPAGHADWFAIKRSSKNLGSYVGTNAFGARVRISRMVEALYEMAPSDFTWFVSQTRATEHPISYVDGEFSVALTCTVDQAKALRPYLSVLFVVSPTEPFYKTDEWSYPATFDLPISLTGTSRALVVSIKAIWVYNSRSGDILLRIVPPVEALDKATAIE